MKFANLRVETKLMLGLAFLAAIVRLVSARSLGGSNEGVSSELAGGGTHERIAGAIHAAFA